ncbi:putative cytochrome P450 6a14 [Calliopsis andreniformis]|uniref:putative cytochrome P450 6a14 n=1 Tax=Calliopsis andreniformis TaxID=337506 RepID=UPI003FCEA778
MLDYFQILCGIAIVLLSLYYYFASAFNVWKNLNIPGPTPSLIFGNMKNSIKRKCAVSEDLKAWYDKYKHEPLFGLYIRSQPLLIVNDLDLIKDILIKDFSLFADRGLPVFPKVEPLGEHLFVLKPEKWRPIRMRLSPVFTSGKLKEMFPLIVECGNHLKKYLEIIVARNEPVDCRDLTAKYTTDVIGSCAFGIDMNSLSDEDNEFRRMSKKILSPSLKQSTRDFCRQFLPRLYTLFGHWLQNTEEDKFFTKVIVDTIKYRKENNVTRLDFVNLLIDIKEHPEKLENIEATDSLLTAQALLFFIAGFETSSATISHALYELAQHHDIQDKLRNEIRETSAKLGHVVTYEHLKEMKYLDKVFKETLRKYPALGMLMREVLENYTFRGTKITIPKGTNIWIPVYGIQMDPNIYPKPEIFDPHRFDEAAEAARHPMSFLPFGDGPRNCIGARFAHLQSKVGLITILRDYKVDVCEKTRIPYKMEERSFLITLKGGVPLKITKIEDSTS